MNKKLITVAGLSILSLASIGSFIYFRTEEKVSCQSLLANRTENHACISTSYGNMVFELYPQSAPKSVERFKALANENKFFNGLEFYRVSKDFVVQGGIQDLERRSASIEQTEEYKSKIKLAETKIDTEANFDSLGLTEEEKTKLTTEGFKSDPNIQSKPFEYGSLSFANAGAGTNSTEIFIATNKTPNSERLKFLNGKFTNMGKLVEGSDVLDKMNSAEINEDYQYATGASEKPAKVIEIKEIVVK